MTNKIYDAETVRACEQVARFYVGNKDCEHRCSMDMETGEVPCALGEEDCYCQTEYIAAQAIADKIKALPTRSDAGLDDPYELIAEAIWRIHVPENDGWIWGQDVSSEYAEKYRKVAKAFINRNTIITALSHTNSKEG